MRFVLATLAQAMEQLTEGPAELAHTVDSQKMTNVTCDLHRGRKAQSESETNAVQRCETGWASR